MQTCETLKHTTWECKYHVVFIPKCRKKVLYGQIRKELGPVLRELVRQKESEVIEGQKCHSHSPGVCRKTAEFYRAALLGPRVLGVHGGQGRSGGAPLYPGAGEGRPAVGPAGANAALSG